MADFHFKVGGTWRTLASNGAKVKVANSWQTVQTIYAKTGSAWQTIWQNQTTPTLSALSDPHTEIVLSGGSTPWVGIHFATDGDIHEDSGEGSPPAASTWAVAGSWLADKTGMDPTEWEILVSVTTEDVGDPGTWTGTTRESYQGLDSGATFIWTKDGTDNGTAESDITITIREKANTSNSASRSNMTYRATITP